jgi:hypothetical protein
MPKLRMLIRETALANELIGRFCALLAGPKEYGVSPGFYRILGGVPGRATASSLRSE